MRKGNTTGLYSGGGDGQTPPQCILQHNTEYHRVHLHWTAKDINQCA